MLVFHNGHYATLSRSKVNATSLLHATNGGWRFSPTPPPMAGKGMGPPGPGVGMRSLTRFQKNRGVKMGAAVNQHIEIDLAHRGVCLEYVRCLRSVGWYCYASAAWREYSAGLGLPCMYPGALP